MTQRKTHKALLTVLCVLCLMFSMLGSIAFAETDVFAASANEDADVSAVTDSGETEEPALSETLIEDMDVFDAAAGEASGDPALSDAPTKDADVFDTAAGGVDAAADEELKEDSLPEAQIEDTDLFDAAVNEESEGSLSAAANYVSGMPLRQGGEQVVSAVITNFEIQTLTYQTPDSLFYNHKFYLAMDWDASHLGATIHQGDYFDITLPDNLWFPSGTTARDFDLKDENYNVIATAHVTPGEGDVGGTVRITFSDFVENKYDVKGSIFLAAQFDRSQITTGENNLFSITVNGDVAGISQTIETGVIITGPKELENEYIGKWGTSVDGNPDVAQWEVRLNHAGAVLSNVTFSDTLGSSGESYIPDSFLLQQVVYDPYGNVITASAVDLSSMLTFSPDSSSFTIDFGDVNGEQYRLIYQSTYTPTTILRNAGTISSAEIERTFRARYISANSGGSGGGSLASKIRIIKVDENDVSIPLANAVFKVTAPNGDSFTLTTGPDGTATSDILQQGTYLVEEIQAPEGYEIIPEESSFTMEVTPAGGSVRRIKNRPIPKIDIPVNKEWDDANDQDGLRPESIIVKLFANDEDTGETLVLSASNNWEGSFTGLNEFENGEKITYRIEEADVEGYTGSVAGDPENGFTITNTHIPEVISVSGRKTWDDNNDQDGIRPKEITIRLLANDVETDSVTVDETNDWSWSFEDLPKYEGGTEIIYSVSEDPVNGYTAEYKGFDVTNIHVPEEVPPAEDPPKEDPPKEDPPKNGTVTNNKTNPPAPAAAQKAPKTADANDMSIYIAAMILSSAVLAGILALLKRKLF